MKTQYRIWIGKRMKYFRDLKSYTQVQMANLIEIPLKTYQSYEEARAEPGLSVSKKFCKNCEISLDDFLQGSPDKNEADPLLSF